MKKIFFLLIIVLSINAEAQNTDYLVSMDGIGAIELGMKQAELEKLLNKKIPLSNPTDTISGSWQDSAKIKYKNADMQLIFQRNYFAADTFDMMIISIKTNSPLCKTKTGIGTGTDKLKIITAYEDLDLSIIPDYTDDDYTVKSKTKAMVNVKNETGKRMIRFFMTNKKVTGIEVKTSFSDEE